jgi:hypothetical protein
MGFMGLSSWVESDGAADFRYVLQQQFKKFAKDPAALKRAVREVVDLELKDMANEYNTPGMVNLALCIEGEDDPGDPEFDDAGLPVFSNLLTVPQLKKASKLFVQEMPHWNPEHKSRLKELHQVIVKALKARRKTNR